MIKSLLGLIIILFIIIKLLKFYIKSIIKNYGWKYVRIKYPDEEAIPFLNTIKNGKWVYDFFHGYVIIYNTNFLKKFPFVDIDQYKQNIYKFDLNQLRILFKKSNFRKKKGGN